MSYSVPVNLTILLSFVIFVFYILGVHNILTNVDDNACEMTYMFEYPQYVEISMSSNIQQTFPGYGLYGYSEGGHTEQLRKMRFNGIPVLFIPGSGGAYKQGRSLASVSLRKWLNSRTQYHFDYFLVDFNEESSGLHGGLLEDQTSYVRHCIEKILSLYKSDTNSQKPNSVILIGHSYGGIIAKGLFIDSKFDTQTVQIIITLASPNKYPLIQLDSYVAAYYNKIQLAWRNNSNLSHISFASIGGGIRDLIVRSDSIYDPLSHVNVLSSAVPGVWCPNDHQSIVWCKQLVLTIVRALFDCVDVNTKKISTDLKYRTSVFKYHFLKRTDGKKYSLAHHNRFATFDRGGNWVENLQRQFTVMESKGTKVNHYIMIRLLLDPKHEAVFIETYNLNIKDWVFVCRADVVYNSVRMCENGENISNLTEVAPTKKLRRKYVHLNLFELKAKSFTHVVVRLPPSESFVQVNIDVHKSTDRDLVHQVPRIYSMSKDVILESTHDNAAYYTITLNGFDSIWQSYVIGLDVLTCKTATSHAVLSFIVPWAAEDSHSFSVDKASTSQVLRLITPRPSNHTGHPLVRLHLDPSCKYKITLKPSLVGSASQIARYYTPMIPAYLAAVLLLTLRQQVSSLSEGYCVFFHSALAAAVKRYYVILQVTILGSRILGLGIFLRILPLPDFYALQELNLDFFVLTILLYGISTILLYTLGLVCYVTIIVSGQAAHKMALRFIAKTITGIISWSEWVFSALHQVPIVVATILISLTLSTSGALGLWVGAAFYFLKLCKMYEDYLEYLFKYSIKLVARKLKSVARGNKEKKESVEEKPKEEKPTEENHTQETEQNPENPKEEEGKEVTKKEEETENKDIGLLSAIHFHVSVFLLWLLTAALYTPSLLIWARNYQYSVLLEKDPGLVPSIVFSVCGAGLWQGGVPHPRRAPSRVTPAILFALASISITYSAVSLYRLGYVLSMSVIVLTFDQLLSKFRK